MRTKSKKISHMIFNHKTLTLQNFSEFVEYLIVRESLGMKTASKYRGALRTFESFRNILPESHHTIDGDLVRDYYIWLRGHRLSESTVSFYLQMLRTVLNKAVNQGLFKMQSGWFTGMVKTYRRDEIKMKSKALSRETMQNIMNVKLDEDLDMARDMFLFSFFSRGMELNDILLLTKDNIDGQYLRYSKRQTGKTMEIAMGAEMQTILNKYSRTSGDNLFPFSITHKAMKDKVRKNIRTIGSCLTPKVSLQFSMAKDTFDSMLCRSNIASMMLNTPA